MRLAWLVPAFAAALLLRLPAAWVLPASPAANFRLASVSGTLWAGEASVVATSARDALTVFRLGWRLQPSAWLRGRLAVTVATDGRPAGEISLGGDGWQWRAARIALPLRAAVALVQPLPERGDWLGTLELASEEFACDWAMTACSGTAEAAIHGLRAQVLRNLDLGPMRLHLTGAAPLRVHWHLEGGDLAGDLETTLSGRKLSIDGRWRPRSEHARAALAWLETLGQTTPDGEMRIVSRCLANCPP